MSARAAIDEVLAHLERLHGDGAVVVVEQLLGAGHRPAEIIDDVLAPAQRAVGERWASGAWTVSQEHAATAIVDDCLGRLAREIPPPERDAPVVALVCAEQEWHVTPARMAALGLRERGWAVSFLGGSTPPAHLRETLALTAPAVAAVSCTLPTALPGAARVGRVAHEEGLPVLGGGAALGAYPGRGRALGLDAVASRVDEASRVLTRWLDDPPPLDGPPPELAAARAETAWLGARVDVLAADALARVEAAGRAAVGVREPGASGDVGASGEQGASGTSGGRGSGRDGGERGAVTRADLVEALQAAEAALTADDPTVWRDHLAWLAARFEVRGLPADDLDRVVGALADAVDEAVRTGGGAVTVAVGDGGDAAEDDDVSARADHPGDALPRTRALLSRPGGAAG